MEFETIDKNEKGEAYLHGVFADLKQFDEDFQDEEIMRLIRAYREKDPGFKAPYIVMDLAPPQGVSIKMKGEEDKYEFSELANEKDDFLKLIVSARQLADISQIVNPFGDSIVKVNQAVPVYRWFIATNTLLKFEDQPGRVIPFPITAPPAEGETEPRYVYHMLIVNPKEYSKYAYALKHAAGIANTFEESFETSARVVFEILNSRGIAQLENDKVDKIITHVHVGQNKGILSGVLLHNAVSDEIRDSEILKENNVIY